MTRQYLIFDADDTLWENNIYFERAIHEFVEFLRHSTLSVAEVRVVLDEVERTMGYGSAAFTRSLVETYRQLAEREVTDEDVQWIGKLGAQVVEQPMELIEGVRETLEYLQPRHTLFLLTKGDVEEQELKIERSGLAGYFQQTLVVPEKNVQTYTQFLEDFELNASDVWMIGNSPKSDINPALKAGMNAVFVPHAHTWSLEHQEVEYSESECLLIVERIAELREHF